MAGSSLARYVIVLALVTSAPASAWASSAAARPKNPPVPMEHVNRHEAMALRLRDGDGKPVKGMQKRFDRFLRCHHTNQQHAMSPRLMHLIYQTGRHWPGHR